MSKNIYKDERPYIVNNLKNVLKRGDYAASMPAKIYGTIADNGKVGNITLNKNKARRDADKIVGAISGRLEHEEVQSALGKGSNAEKAFMSKLKEDKSEYTTGQAYADDYMEMKAGVYGKSNLEHSVRKTNPASRKSARKATKK